MFGWSFTGRTLVYLSVVILLYIVHKVFGCSFTRRTLVYLSARLVLAHYCPECKVANKQKIALQQAHTHVQIWISELVALCQ